MKFSLIMILAIATVAAVNTDSKPVEQPSRANNDSAWKANQRTKHFRLTKDRVAIDGYDPVSYFKSGGPQKGNVALAYDYDGVIYWFANAANRTEFNAHPSQYEPAWGGWCGHAMALRGEKVEINPTCYKIVNGRNVLFFKTFYANALTNWEKELKKTPENMLMMKGDDFWGKTVLQ